jgi:hypothetical protein
MHHLEPANGLTNSPAQIPATPPNRALQWLFCGCVLALALYQFSENTADPDLWGHTMFGERLLLTGKLERFEPYSWTAPDVPWVNHEVLAEAAIGGAHRLAGGAGILLLKIAAGFLTLAIALRLGGERMPWPPRALAWALGALAVVEISFGFAARPQIFTALALAIQLWLLRCVHQGKLRRAFALPVLFALWINTHGGVLAGIIMMVVTAGATSAQLFWVHRRGKSAGRESPSAIKPRLVAVLWLACIACVAALLANPWGFGLIRWLIGSVLWLRPEIGEWNSTYLGWDHAALFILILLAAISFALSRCPRALWEIAVCAVLALFALRSVRHTPLFAIAALAFVPPHLANVLARYREHFSRLEESFCRPQTQTFFTGLCGLTCAGILFAAFTLHKEHPLTMEVPKGHYPDAAIAFIRQNDLRGNLLVFFDWGEMCLWELPGCPVSIDGRLDTCYPRELIAEHWKFYNAQPVNEKILNLDQADLALLPINLAGALALGKTPGWQAAYLDDLAVVLVREAQRFPVLQRGNLPIRGAADAAIGRVPFPHGPSARITPAEAP